MRKWFVFLFLFLFLAFPALAEPPTRDYTTVTKVETTTSATADNTLWDPDAGKRIVILGVAMSSTGFVDVELEVSDVDVINPIHLGSPGTYLKESGGRPIYVGDKDGVLNWTASIIGRGPNQTFPDVSIMVWGYEETV